MNYDRSIADAFGCADAPAILIAEDEPLLQMALEEIVGDLGCVVAGSVASVKDALSAIAKLEFTAAILDVNLTDGPIDPVVVRLRERGIPFVFATGALTTPLAATGPVVAKPYNPDEIKAALIKAGARA